MQELQSALREKLQAQRKREQEVRHGMDKFIASQAEKSRQKMEATEEKRAAILKALNDRLKQKHKHVEWVKRCTMESAQDMDVSGDDLYAEFNAIECDRHFNRGNSPIDFFNSRPSSPESVFSSSPEPTVMYM